MGKTHKFIDLHDFVTKNFNIYLNNFISVYSPPKRGGAVARIGGRFNFVDRKKHPVLTPLAHRLVDERKNLLKYSKGNVDEKTFRLLIAHLSIIYEESKKLEYELPEITQELVVPLSKLFNYLDSYWGNSYYNVRLEDKKSSIGKKTIESSQTGIGIDSAQEVKPSSMPKCKECGRKLTRTKPKICNFCKETFCKFHHSTVHHKCSKYTPPPPELYELKYCSFCSKPLMNKKKVKICAHCNEVFCKKHVKPKRHDCAKYTPPQPEPEYTEPKIEKKVPLVKGINDEDIQVKNKHEKLVIVKAQLIEKIQGFHIRYIKPVLNHAIIRAPLILKYLVVLLVALSVFQPQFAYEKAPQETKPYLDRIKNSRDNAIKTISANIGEWFQPKQEQDEPVQSQPYSLPPASPIPETRPSITPSTTQPHTLPPTTTPPTQPKIILDPLPPGYHKKYEVTDIDYNDQKFPAPDPKTYSKRIVGEYGEVKYSIFEREKKVYAFEFTSESLAEEFLNQFTERVKRHELPPRIIEISPVKINFRFTYTNQYNGAYFRLGKHVYYLKRDFLEPADFEFIKENFFGVEIKTPETTTPPQTTLPPKPTSPPKTEAPKPEHYDFERQIFDLINVERKFYGLRELTWNDRIASAARKHSEDMGIYNYFEHDSLDGRDLSSRLRDESIPCTTGCGENIYMHPEALYITIINGREYPEYLAQDEIAQMLVNGWMNSPGHRKNILTDWFRLSGMGVYYIRGYYYVTQDFLG